MTDPAEQPSKPAPRKTIQPPKGTRDFYPADMLRRRYITDAWRRVSLRHGFEEIDGPTFETAELYAVKSGEGILGEMFGVYSGKSPEDVESVKQGTAPFGLRPEFTPTLARMYAARARQLPQPTKWFSVGNYFRAERPQRGRLREFWQWNADVIGGDDASGDFEVLGTAISMLEDTGVTHDYCMAKYNDRRAAADYFLSRGVLGENISAAFELFDDLSKISVDDFITRLLAVGFTPPITLEDISDYGYGKYHPSGLDAYLDKWLKSEAATSPLSKMYALLASCGYADSWTIPDGSIVRGLAYYTGLVFEVIAEGERAVAGGGRYDNLIELFGGPPTPAVGFGMGDVVLGNLLDDHKLIPEGPEMLRALARPMPYRPDAFIVCPSEDAEAQHEVIRLCARLRRGVERDDYTARAQAWSKDHDPAQHPRPWDEESRYGVPPLHARRSYKSTKNLGKLLQDASACHARFAVIVESSTAATLKNLDDGRQIKAPIEKVGAFISGLWTPPLRRSLRVPLHCVARARCR